MERFAVIRVQSVEDIIKKELDAMYAIILKGGGRKCFEEKQKASKGIGERNMKWREEMGKKGKEHGGSDEF